MKDKDKTKQQLVAEISDMRHQISRLRDLETRYKWAENTLRRTKASYQAIVEDQTELVCRFLPNGKLTFVNNTYCRYFGKERDELIGGNFTSLIPGKDQETVKKHLASLSPEFPVATIEHQVIMPNGGVYWQQRTDRAIFNDQGQVVEFQSVGRDITTRKRIEEELLFSEELFRRVVLSISDHIYVTEITKDGRPINIYLSPHAETLTGYPLEKFVDNWSFWPSTVIHPDDRTAAAAQANRLAQGQNSEVEYRLIRADGAIIWVRDSGTTEYNERTSSITVYGVVSDITERKRLEEQLLTIYQLGQKLDQFCDEAAIFEYVLHTVAGLLQVEIAGYALVDEKTGQLKYHYQLVRGLLKKTDLDLPLNEERGIGVAVVNSGQAINVADTAKDPRYVPISKELAVGAYLSVPMKIGKRVIGVLDVESGEPNRFTPRDQQLLQTLANHATVAVENARLYAS